MAINSVRHCFLCSKICLYKLKYLKRHLILLDNRHFERPLLRTKKIWYFPITFPSFQEGQFYYLHKFDITFILSISMSFSEWNFDKEKLFFRRDEKDENLNQTLDDHFNSINLNVL